MRIIILKVRLRCQIVYSVYLNVLNIKYCFSTDGYLAVDIVLQHKNFKGQYDKSDVERVVNNNDKQRFKLRWNSHTNTLEIKANQGHSIEIDDSDLIPILEVSVKKLLPFEFYF